MTRKHYALIANAIREVNIKKKTVSQYKKELTYNIARALNSDNCRFDYDRFIDACYDKNN